MRIQMLGLALAHDVGSCWATPPNAMSGIAGVVVGLHLYLFSSVDMWWCECHETVAPCGGSISAVKV